MTKNVLFQIFLILITQKCLIPLKDQTHTNMCFVTSYIKMLKVTITIYQNCISKTVNVRQSQTTKNYTIIKTNLYHCVSVFRYCSCIQSPFVKDFVAIVLKRTLCFHNNLQRHWKKYSTHNSTVYVRTHYSGN